VFFESAVNNGHHIFEIDTAQPELLSLPQWMIVAANQVDREKRVALAVAEFVRSQGVGGALADVEDWQAKLFAATGLTPNDLAQVFAAIDEVLGAI
jgi:hypothetical protein